MNRRLIVLCLLLFICAAFFSSRVEGFSTAKKKSRSGKKKRRSGKPDESSENMAEVKTASEDVDVEDMEEKTCSGGDGTCSESAESREDSRRSDSGTSIFALQHSVGVDEPFVDRGHIEVEISKLSKQITIRVRSRDSLDATEAKALLALAETGGFYRLRLPSIAGTTSNYVMASIPACALVVGGLREQLFLHLDFSGQIIGVEYRTPLSKSFQCKKESLKKALRKHRKKLSKDDSIKLSTSAVAVMPRKAHKVPLVIKGGEDVAPPPGMEHLKKKSKTDPNAPENQSFLRR